MQRRSETFLESCMKPLILFKQQNLKHEKSNKKNEATNSRIFQKAKKYRSWFGRNQRQCIALPVTLPAIVTQIAGYIAVAGTVASTVSQAAVKNDLK